MKIRKFIIIVILMFFLGAVLALGSFISNLQKQNFQLISFINQIQNPPPQSPQNTEKNPTVTIKDIHVFNVEIADTEEKRTLGFMNRTEIPDNSGMIFIYDTPGKRNFWMMNTPTPLDLLHIYNNEIIEIIENMQPCLSTEDKRVLCPNYPSSSISDFSFEIKGGTVKKLGLKPGDKVKLSDIDIPVTDSRN